jgi:hypothetical protein
MLAQYSNYGSPFIQFLFGHKAAHLFKEMSYVKAIDVISIALAGKFSGFYARVF